MDVRDANALTTTQLTLNADVLFHEFTGASWPSVSGPLVVPATSQLRAVRIRSVTTQACAMRLGPSGEGLASGGYLARLTLPDTNLAEWLDGKAVTIGNLTVRFSKTAASSGTTLIGLADKTRSQIRTELLALITAGATGIADLTKAASLAPGVIVLQSAANGNGITISTTASASGLLAEGFVAAYEIRVAVGTSPLNLEYEVPPNADVRCISLRAQTSGSVVTIEAYWTTRSV